MKNKILSITNILSILAFFLFFNACSSPDLELPDETPQDVYAIDSLTGSDNGSYVLDEEMLAEVVGQIEKGHYGNMNSLIIIHNDELVLEEYFNGWNRHMLHDSWSMTKSFTSSLIGIAIEQGYINGVDEKLLDFFPEYDDFENFDERKESITLEHVLTMSAGFSLSKSSKMSDSTDWIKFMLDIPVTDDPGTTFAYSSGGSHLLSGILQNTTGQTTEEFAVENLFNTLGITDWEWSTDPNGISTGGWGLSLHPANMAVFGYLFLKNGWFNGKQVVPGNWVKQSTAKHITSMTMWGGSMDGIYDYGYQWWRLNDSFLETMWRGSPPETNDIFYALGYGGQYIYVIPHLNMVIVVTAWELYKSWQQSFLFNDIYNTVKEK